MNKKKLISIILAITTALTSIFSLVYFVADGFKSTTYGEAVAEYDKAKARYDIAYAAYLEDKDTFLNEDRRALQQEDSADVIYIDIRGYGILSVKLYPEVAPITVNNFKSLVGEGFYDFLTFHRVINDFVIQTGSPDGSGIGGSDRKIKGEFTANGVENNLKHTAGVVSMARAQSYNSASSQFFIVEEDSTKLDGQYAAFGKVTIGMDIVHAIAAVKTDSNDKPIEPVYIRRIVLDKEELYTLEEPVAPTEPSLFGFFAPAFITSAVAILALGGTITFLALFIREDKAIKRERLAEIERNRRAAVAAARAKKKPKKK